MFAGLRPLAAPDKDTDSTKEISRDHKLMVSDTGLITITGGKWTTYRKMAEETVNKIVEVAGMEKIACRTKKLPIHGSNRVSANTSELATYGSDEASVRGLSVEKAEFAHRLTDGFPFIKAQVIWAVRKEMARTVEDVLARRLRLLFLDARAAIRTAPEVARLMAPELGMGDEWIQKQVADFIALANNYLPEPYVQKKMAGSI
jgi:glycerol-3-phosphate dehydrogenase